MAINLIIHFISYMLSLSPFPSPRAIFNTHVHHQFKCYVTEIADNTAVAVAKTAAVVVVLY